MRWLEINHLGMAFHEPGPTSPFSTGETSPPTQIWFCDCQGKGVICHHVYGRGADEIHREIHGPQVNELPQIEFLKKHTGPRCNLRRQFFVNVTHRPEAELGMRYDEAKDTFSKV